MISVLDSISPTDCHTHFHKCMGSRLMWAVFNVEYNSDNFHNLDLGKFDPWSTEWALNYETPDTENK